MKVLLFLFLLTSLCFAQYNIHDYCVAWDLNTDGITEAYRLFVSEMDDPIAVYDTTMVFDESIAGYVGRYLHTSFTDSAEVTYSSPQNGKYLQAMLFAEGFHDNYSGAAVSAIYKKDTVYLTPQTPVVELRCGD